MSSFVFIDSRVADIERLIGGPDAGVQVVILDPAHDGMTQIAAALAGTTDLDSIHIVSHGSEGALYIGDTVLTEENLDSYQSELTQIGDALSKDGDLLLYGSNVGTGTAAASFIASLAAYTGADVTTSTADTGSAALLGDWALEANAGAIEAQAIASIGFDATLSVPAFSSVVMIDATLSTDSNITTSFGTSSGTESLSPGADAPLFLGADAIAAVTGATVVVSNTGDATNGDVSSIAALIANPGGDGISLREALLAVNATSGVHTIAFGAGLAGQSIAITESLPALTRSNVTLQGIESGGEPAVTLDFSEMTPHWRNQIFQVLASDVTISDLGFVGMPSRHVAIFVVADSELGAPLVEHVIIERCHFEASSGIDAYAVRIGQDAEQASSNSTVRDIRVESNTFLNFEGDVDAVHLQASGTNGLIRDVVISGNEFINSTNALELVTYSGSNDRILDTRIVGNTFLDNGQSIVLLGGTGSTGGLIDGTLIAGNVILGIEQWGIGATGGIGTGIDNTISNTTVANNLMHAGALQGGGVINIIASQDGEPRNSIDGFLIVNNTLHGVISIDPNSLEAGSTISGVVVQNNILTAENVFSDVFSSGELLESVTHTLLPIGANSLWVGMNGNIVADPLFVNPGAGDFSLQPGSPAIDAGLGTGAPNLDFDYLSRADDPDTADTGLGTPTFVDMGAFEFLGGLHNDLLRSTSDDDTLNGGAGRDTVSYAAASTGVRVDLSLTDRQNTIGHGADTLTGIENVVGSDRGDVLTGNAGSNLLKGFQGADLVRGRGGNDTLFGGSGNDLMVGGSGNDMYVLVRVGEVVREAPSAGIDQIQAAVTLTGLAANVENLRLMGNGNLDATGNALANIIYANTGDNLMNGGGAPDTVSFQYGATSGVTVSLASALPQVTGGSGTDTFSHIERLTGSNFSDDITGNVGNNVLLGLGGSDTLRGSGGHDVLDGGGGADRLTGGAGADKFDFNAVLNVTTNVDQITDFSVVSDTIRLDDDIFTAFATANVALAAGAFYEGVGVTAAHDSTDRIIYNTTTGNLYYDADGLGGAASKLFATLTTHPTMLTAADFFIIA